MKYTYDNYIRAIERGFISFYHLNGAQLIIHAWVPQSVYDKHWKDTGTGYVTIQGWFRIPLVSGASEDCFALRVFFPKRCSDSVFTAGEWLTDET